MLIHVHVDYYNNYYMSREKKIIRTSFLGILGNIVLVIIKAIFGFLANSISIVLDAANNLSDALSSTITIIGTKLAHKKPDAKHPYGHGRVEYVTSMIISFIILFTGIVAIYEAIMTFIEPRETSYTTTTIIIVAIGIGVKIALGLYFKLMGKKLDSGALQGSGLDALFDALLSLGTLVGIITSILWKVKIEAYLGIVIGLFIIKSGVSLFRSALSSLIGERANSDITNGIKDMVCSHKEVLGAYDLIINNYGPQRAIGSIHIEVDDSLQAKDIHPLTRKITEEVFLRYGVILTVGIYASNTSDEETKEIKLFLANLISEHQQIKQLHGFYMDKERMMISFDLIFDFSCPNIEEIKNELIGKLKEKFPQYDYYIVIDNDFSD